MSRGTNSSIRRSNRILKMQTPPQVPIPFPTQISSFSSSRRKRKPHFISPLSKYQLSVSLKKTSSSSTDSAKKSIPITATKSSNSTTTSTSTMKADAADGLPALRPPRRSPRFSLSNLNPLDTSGRSPSLVIKDVRAVPAEGLLALGPRRSTRFVPSNTTPTPQNNGTTTPSLPTSISSSKSKRRPTTRCTPPSPRQKKLKTSNRGGIVQEDNSARQLCKESSGLQLPKNKTSSKSRKNTHFISIQNVSTEKTNLQDYPQTPKVGSCKSMGKIDDGVKERFELDGTVNEENTPQHFMSKAFSDSLDEEVLPQKGNVQGPNSSEDYKGMIKVDKDVKSLIFPAAMMPGGRGGPRTSGNINVQMKEIGDKRAGNPSGDNWMKNQELALHKAYFNAKPSPHFWKKVSKMVPGKSAQECFDKIHSEAITPPQPQPRSRAKRTNLSPLGQFSLSASKLLEPANQNTERLKKNKQKKNKQKKCDAHKTVRHLLQKHNQLDQGYEADVFPLYQHAMNSSSQSPLKTNLLSTPPCSLKSNGIFQEYHERSSPSNKMQPHSRFRESRVTTALASPPVLKQIKNKALHEKYIDQLHCREARRMAGQKQRITAKDGGNLQNVNVAAARNALVSDARDVIKQFRDMQAHANDADDDDVSRGEEDEDDELGL